jgi:hypothetical protein
MANMSAAFIHTSARARWTSEIIQSPIHQLKINSLPKDVKNIQFVTVHKNLSKHFVANFFKPSVLSYD